MAYAVGDDSAQSLTWFLLPFAFYFIVVMRVFFSGLRFEAQEEMVRQLSAAGTLSLGRMVRGLFWKVRALRYGYPRMNRLADL